METPFKKECLKMGLTARDVSEKTGIPKRTIHSYFDGTRSPQRKNRKILKESLNLKNGLFD